MNAWLVTSKGEKIEVLGNCHLGRGADNTLILPGDLVSKNHAMIHLQGQGDYFLVDLGSTNGTFINSGRISKPTRLNDGDLLGVGANKLVFHTATSSQEDSSGETSGDTLVAMEEDSEHWLLVADVIGFTPLSQQFSSSKLARKIGSWIATCQKVLETNGATINKYLGDGFLAYWPATETPASQVVETICRLHELQKAQLTQEIPLPFRAVVHHGQVLISRSLAEGKDEMIGQNVNFTFRMEKVAAGLEEPFLLSSSAAERLQGLARLHSRGNHPVKDFEGSHEFFAFLG